MPLPSAIAPDDTRADLPRRATRPREVATVGAPADPAHVSHLFKDRIEEIEREGQAEVSIGGRPFTMQKSFIETSGILPLHGASD